MNNANLNSIPYHFPVIVQYWSNYCLLQGVALVNALILSNLDCKYGHRSYIAKN